MRDAFSPSNGGNQFISPGSGSDSFSTESNLSRTLPRQMSTGALRGTQNVGYGGVKIDGSNNTIVLGSSAGSGTVGSIVLDGNASTIVVSQNLSIDGTKEQISVSDNGKDVITMGKNTDGTFNFRVDDANGIGIAQFGQFPDGSIALKVAQAGIEVSTATPQQLVFSSSASFTVAIQGSYTFPSFGSVPSNTLNPGSFTTIPHDVGFIPGVNCFTPLVFPGVIYGVAPVGFPISDVSLITNGSAIVQVEDMTGNAFFNLFYTVDNTNLYIGASFQNSTSSTVVALPLTIYYVVFTLNAA